MIRNYPMFVPTGTTCITYAIACMIVSTAISMVLSLDGFDTSIVNH